MRKLFVLILLLAIVCHALATSLKSTKAALKRAAKIIGRDVPEMDRNKLAIKFDDEASHFRFVAARAKNFFPGYRNGRLRSRDVSLLSRYGPDYFFAGYRTAATDPVVDQLGTPLRGFMSDRALALRIRPVDNYLATLPGGPSMFNPSFQPNLPFANPNAYIVGPPPPSDGMRPNIAPNVDYSTSINPSLYSDMPNFAAGAPYLVASSRPTSAPAAL